MDTDGVGEGTLGKASLVTELCESFGEGHVREGRDRGGWRRLQHGAKTIARGSQ